MQAHLETVLNSARASPRPDPQTSPSAPRAWRTSWPAIGTAALLVAIAIVALALRFVNLGWGQPFVYHPDEWVVVNPALNMVRTGSWNPGLFTYPSGLIYVERFIISGLHLLNAVVSLATSSTGGYAGTSWRGPSDALLEQFDYFYAGRAFVAVVGALMALPTYFAARSVSNVFGGIAAAVVIAVAPLAVSNSHYLTTDVPTAALAATTLWLSLRGLGVADGGSPRQASQLAWLHLPSTTAGWLSSSRWSYC